MNGKTVIPVIPSNTFLYGQISGDPQNYRCGTGTETSTCKWGKTECYMAQKSAMGWFRPLLCHKQQLSVAPV